MDTAHCAASAPCGSGTGRVSAPKAPTRGRWEVTAEQVLGAVPEPARPSRGPGEAGRPLSLGTAPARDRRCGRVPGNPGLAVPVRADATDPETRFAPRAAGSGRRPLGLSCARAAGGPRHSAVPVSAEIPIWDTPSPFYRFSQGKGDGSGTVEGTREQTGKGTSHRDDQTQGPLRLRPHSAGRSRAIPRTKRLDSAARAAPRRPPALASARQEHRDLESTRLSWDPVTRRPHGVRAPCMAEDGAGERGTDGLADAPGDGTAV